MSRNPLEEPGRPQPTKPYMPSPEEYAASAGATLPSHQRKRKGSWLRRVVSAFVCLCLVLVLAVGSYAGYLAYNVAKISTKPLDFSGVAEDANGRTNILILGVGDPGHAGERLSDSMMVLSIDSRLKRVAQISLPRDLRVDIPEYGRGKINVAHAVGGITLAEQTVSNTLDIPIHYYVRTNFSGLKGLVDAVGGLDVDVQERLYDPEFPCADDQYKSCGLDIRPGLQHMDGELALAYARCRKGTCGNDFGRAERQQEIMNLLRDKLVQWDLLWHPQRLIRLVDVVRASSETDMAAIQLLWLAERWQLYRDNEPVHLVLSTAKDGYLRNDPYGTSDLVPIGGNFLAIQDRVKNIFAK